jgi:cytochrome c-type biogenesis protein CcmH
MKRALLSLFVMGWLALLAAPQGVQAVEAPLSDPALEVRAQNLAREIRCVVCENEPVALSSAEIAVDMRKAMASLFCFDLGLGSIPLRFGSRH